MNKIVVAILATVFSMSAFADLTTCRTDTLKAILTSKTVQDLNKSGDRVLNIETYHEIDEANPFGTGTMSSPGDSCIRLTTAQKMSPERTIVFLTACAGKGLKATVKKVTEVKGESQDALDAATSDACGI